MTNTQYGRLTVGLIAAWFLVCFTASAQHLLQNNAGTPPLALGLTALTPLAVFGIWYAISQGFRSFVLSLNAQTLTIIQSWRIAGYVFLVASVYQLLPPLFAHSAGWGDVFIGITAPFVALRLANPDHRASFLVWNFLGIADLVSAVTLGSTTQFIDPHAVATSAMTVLPLSLIPSFAVPLFLILHVISIAQARRWPVRNEQIQTRLQPAAR
jgi:hypothetical protein